MTNTVIKATAWGVRAGTQDRNLEADAEAETQEELDCFHLAQFAFEYNLGPSVYEWPCPLGCPTTTSIINQENLVSYKQGPTDLLIGQFLMEA